MASLESIRKRSGLLIAFIGIALLAFVLGDFLNGGSSMFGGGKPIVGEINGEEVDYQDFEIELKELTQLQGPQADQDQVRNGLWNDKVNTVLLNEEYEKSGLSITDEELASNTIGYNNREVSPIVKRIFGIQPGQEVSNAQLSNGIAQLKKNDPLRWKSIQNIISKQLVNEKLNVLVTNAYSVSDLEAKAKYNAQTRVANGKYVYKSYASVSPENKTVTDADIKAYYDANKESFKQNGSAKLQYAVFNVAPTAEDNALVKSKINKLMKEQIVFNKDFAVNDTIPGFEDTKDVADFMREYSDIPYNANYLAKGELPSNLDTLMHSKAIGFVHGPYFENGMYKVARLVDSKNDSVQVAILGMEVLASDASDKKIFTEASSFAMKLQSTSFEEASKGMTANTTFTELVSKEAANLPGVGKDRSVIRWAFNKNTELGSFKRFDLGDKYVIAKIESRFEKGYADFNSIKEQLRPATEVEKAKEYLKNQLGSVADLNTAATKLGVATADFTNLNLESNTVGSAGYDPIAVGAIMGIEKGSTSSVITGKTGVFVATVENIVEPTELTDFTAVKSQIENTFAPRVNYELVKSLRDAADITDNRADYY